MFECHITINKPSTAEAFLRLEALGKKCDWKTSYIKSDPVLGKDAYFYFTRHNNDIIKLKDELLEMSCILSFDGNKIIREKIEQIVYDTKTGIGIT